MFVSAAANLAGAFVTVAVAKTIGKDLIDTTLITNQVLLAALLGAIAWNLLTWWLGLPSSSTHALVGGLCGKHRHRERETGHSSGCAERARAKRRGDHGLLPGRNVGLTLLIVRDLTLDRDPRSRLECGSLATPA